MEGEQKGCEEGEMGEHTCYHEVTVFALLLLRVSCRSTLQGRATEIVIVLLQTTPPMPVGQFLSLLTHLSLSLTTFSLSPPQERQAMLQESELPLSVPPVNSHV